MHSDQRRVRDSSKSARDVHKCVNGNDQPDREDENPPRGIMEGEEDKHARDRTGRPDEGLRLFARESANPRVDNSAEQAREGKVPQVFAGTVDVLDLMADPHQEDNGEDYREDVARLM